MSSVDDTDEWASMIINQLFDDEISKCTEGKEAIEKNEFYEVSHHDNHNVNQSDLLGIFGANFKEPGLTSNTNSRISDDLDEANRGLSASKENSTCTTSDCIMKANDKLMQESRLYQKFLEKVESGSGLIANNFESFDGGENLRENVNVVATIDSSIRNWHLKDEGDGNIVKSKYRALKQKQKKSIFTDCKNSIKKQEEQEFAEDIEGIDIEEIEIRDERVELVVSTYRDICSRFETIFVRPFANVLADFYDFLKFIFFLIVCLLCLFYEQMQVLILNYRSRNVKKSVSSSCDEAENILLGTEELVMSTVPTDAMLTDEMLYHVKEKSNLTIAENEVIKQLKDIDSFVNIEPSELVVVSMKYEIATENKTNFYEKGEHFLTYLDDIKQHRTTVKTNDDCLIDFRFISYNENEGNKLLLSERDFYLEIMASSKRLSTDVDKINAHEDMENSCYLAEISSEYDGKPELKPTNKKSSFSSLIELLPEKDCKDGKPLFNSTEVDGFVMESTAKQRSCPDFDVLSDSNMNCSKMGITRRNSLEECLNCSLAVNLSFLSSRSDILNESAPFLDGSKGVHDDEIKQSADDDEILDEMQKEDCEVLSSSNLEVSATEDSENVFMVETEKVSIEEDDESYFDKTSKDSSLNPNDKSHMEEHSSGSYQRSDAADVHSKDNSDLESCSMCCDAKCITDLPSSSSECYLPVNHETIPNEVKGNPRQKNNLRRRLSLIFNNWRNKQVMPSCIAKSHQSKK